MQVPSSSVITPVNVDCRSARYRSWICYAFAAGPPRVDGNGRGAHSLVKEKSKRAVRRIAHTNALGERLRRRGM